MEKILSIILEIIRFIIRIPYAWIPDKYKGYRTRGLTIAVGVLAALQLIDWFTLESAINQIGQLFNPNFLINIPEEIFVTWIGFALAELRKETNTEYSKFEFIKYLKNLFMKYFSVLIFISILFSSCGTFQNLGLNCGVTLSESGCKHEPHSCDPPPKLKTQKAFGEKSTLWTDKNTLKVYFIDGSTKQKNFVRKYMVGWNNLGNIKIQETSKVSDSDCRVSFKYSGSWSYVGTDNKYIGKSSPTMNYGWIYDDSDEDEVRRVVLHEFGHLVGLQHEHQHPKAGISWDSTATFEYYGQQGWSKQEVIIQVMTVASVDNTNFTKYDKKSIMHYPVPATLTTNGYFVDWNTSLSANDKKWASTYYPYTCKIIRP